MAISIGSTQINDIVAGDQLAAAVAVGSTVVWRRQQPLATATYVKYTASSGLPDETLNTGITLSYNDLSASRDDVQEVSVGTSVEAISDGAFKRMHSLKKVVVPGSTWHIGYQAFMYCNDLADVLLSEGVRVIDGKAFYGSGLSSLVVPSSVSSIGISSFGYCQYLTSLAFKGKSLQQVSAMANYPWGLADASVISAELS